MRIEANKKDRILKDIGIRLQVVRKHLNFQQNDFAREIGISNSNLSEIEAGKIRPGFGLLYNISGKFGVNLDYILHGRGSMFIGGGDNGSKGPGSGDLFDFRDLTEEQRGFLEEFLGYFKKSKVVRYSVMSFFTAFMIRSKKLIELESGNPAAGGDFDLEQDLNIDVTIEEINSRRMNHES